MSEQILVPALGESITEATVSKWLKKPGEKVIADDPIVELETDKVNLEVPSPVDGVFTEQQAKEGDTVKVGAVLGIVTQGENKSDTETPVVKNLESLKETEQKKILIKAFLNKLSSHISKGASFEAFAKLHSQHPSYKNGGVTDWLTINNPTLEMLDNLNENEVSKIYSTVFGLAIAIKIDERFISSKLKDCEDRVIYQNAEKYYTQWLKDLREQAFIEIYYDKL